MKNTSIRGEIIHWLWLRLTRAMWKAGYGRPYMISRIDELHPHHMSLFSHPTHEQLP